MEIKKISKTKIKYKMDKNIINYANKNIRKIFQ
jgi:hypothetical protein